MKLLVAGWQVSWKLVAPRQEGAALTEYGLILGLIALVCIACIACTGTKASVLFSAVVRSL